MIGTYRFYQNGELLLASKNVITDVGKRTILRRLSDQGGSIGNALAVGVGQNAATTTDTRLAYEVERVRVDLKSVDYTNNTIIFRGTLPQTSVYTIYEVGVWSEYSNALAGDSVGRVLATFDSANEAWSNSTNSTATGRTSANSINVSVPSNSTVSTRNTSVSLNLSAYSANDSFVLAFYKPSSNVVGLKLVFGNSTTGGAFTSSEVSIAAMPLGYNVIQIPKNTFTATGTVSWSDINSFGIDARAGASAGSIYFDGLRVEDDDTVNIDYSLVSRSVLTTPLVKTNIIPMDIEYGLELAIG